LGTEVGRLATKKKENCSLAEEFNAETPTMTSGKIRKRKRATRATKCKPCRGSHKKNRKRGLAAGQWKKNWARGRVTVKKDRKKRRGDGSEYGRKLMVGSEGLDRETGRRRAENPRGERRESGEVEKEFFARPRRRPERNVQKKSPRKVD